MLGFYLRWPWRSAITTPETVFPPRGEFSNPLVYSTPNDSHFLIGEHDLGIGRLKALKSLITLPSEDPKLKGAPSPDFSAAAVIHWPSTSNENYLDRRIKYFLKDADFECFFLQTIILAYELEDVRSLNLSEGVVSLLKGFNCRVVMSLPKGARNIPEGPYFVQGQQLHRTWKLFPDIYEAFQLPTIQLANTDKFRPFTYMHNGNLMVPVPSRLHFPQTLDKPFNGLRVTVKDIIHLKGVKTTAQSRSFAKTYADSTHNAAVVSRLIELGAVIIGKTKCTQFASADQPTADWVDYHCPWNPRGDGYLSPRGSSTGTCVALAGYDWVDLGVGSDTGGSIRGPAAVMGLFALRPSQAHANMEGILPIIQGIDTPGLVCRDIARLHKVSKALFKSPSPKMTAAGKIANGDPNGGKRVDFRRPAKILYPSDYWGPWLSNSHRNALEQRDAVECFVQKLEEFLGIDRTPINLAEEWIQRNPANSQSRIEVYLEDTFMNLLCRGYHDEYQTFQKEYRAKFGNPPYVHPVIQDYWDRGSKISDQEIKTAKEHREVYQQWLRERVLDGDDFHTIMVFPATSLTPFYRDDYRNDPKRYRQPYNWNDRADHQSSLAGVPNIVVPVGQTRQDSKITSCQELPIAVHVISGAGTDDALTELFQRMAEQSLIKGSVNTGATAFDSA
ncbi:amidase signature domain-containing protein [Nemania abortiva]|nr:amidase signature domain-containing protein [Nemania abortiva]